MNPRVGCICFIKPPRDANVRRDSIQKGTRGAQPSTVPGGTMPGVRTGGSTKKTRKPPDVVSLYGWRGSSKSLTHPPFVCQPCLPCVSHQRTGYRRRSHICFDCEDPSPSRVVVCADRTSGAEPEQVLGHKCASQPSGLSSLFRICGSTFRRGTRRPVSYQAVRAVVTRKRVAAEWSSSRSVSRTHPSFALMLTLVICSQLRD